MDDYKNLHTFSLQFGDNMIVHWESQSKQLTRDSEGYEALAELLKSVLICD